LENPLQDLIAFCYGQSDPVSEEKCRYAMQFDKEALFPRTAQKCARMLLLNLKEQGYASFIE
jgi:hypothetical protein